MKKTSVLYTILMLCLCGVVNAQTSLNTATETIIKENIAVLDFTDSANRYRDESKKVRELIEDMLVNMKRFNIIDRKNLDKYIEEMKLQYSGLTDGDVVEAGKIQGFNKAVYGSVVRYDVINTPPIIMQLIDGGFDIKPGYSKVDIAVSIKIVDVATTKIIYSKIVAGSGISYVNDLIYTKSVSLAQQDAYDNFIANLHRQLKNVFKYNIKIADIQKGDNVVLLAGLNVGLAPSTRFNVYSKGNDIKLSSGRVLSGDYKKIGSIKVTSVGDDYSIARINRGNISVGDIAQETQMGNSFFSIYPVFTAFNVQGESRVIKSDYTDFATPNGGSIKIDRKEIKYTGGLYFKSGYMFNMLSPYFSGGIIFGDFFKSAFAADIRLGIDINVPLYREVVSLKLSPFVGFAFTFAKIGTVEENYYSAFAKYLRAGEDIWKSEVHIGAGSHLVLEYKPTDSFGISLGVGYKFFKMIDTISVYTTGLDDNDSLEFPQEIRDLKSVNLTGIEALVSVNFFF